MTSTRPVRHVVFHTPGPKWKPGVDFREQEELESFAASSPAVHAGLLNYEVRPWLTAMEHQ